MSTYRVKIVCNGEVMSNELNEFPSIWRAFSDTACEQYKEEYHPSKVARQGGVYCMTFKDGTQIIVERSDVQTRVN